MAKPDEGEVSADVMALARTYLDIYNRIAALEEAAADAKRALFAAIGDVEQYPDIEIGAQRLVYGRRRTARKPDAVALMRAGIPKEEFSTITPTLAAFWRMVDRNEWDRTWAEKYIIDSGETVQTVSVRTDQPNNDEEE